MRNLTTFVTPSDMNHRRSSSRDASIVLLWLLVACAGQAELTQVAAKDLKASELPGQIRQEIGRWEDHPFVRLPPVQFDSARLEGSKGRKQELEVIHREGPYAVMRTRDTTLHGKEQDKLVLYLGLQTLGAVAQADWGRWSRRTLGFSNLRSLRPAPTAKSMNDVRPEDLSVEYDWNYRVGSKERSLHAKWQVTGITEVKVTVNGTDFQLPAFELQRVLQDRYKVFRSDFMFKYVPVLGAWVESDGMQLTSAGEREWSSRMTEFQVSDSVLERVRAAANLPGR